jgi:molybdate transport system ATP-binding protein
MTFSLLLQHRFPGIAIDVAFDAPADSVTVLFGPSGAGKSTIINAIAGLLRPDVCRIVVDGHVLTDTAADIALPIERRRIGLVFQDSRLFPHMSVATNLRFGLRRAAPGQIRFDDVVTLLGIGDLLQRRPHTLSGGERQRVAIGRALLAQPQLLLMDEPLAGLDATRKAEILPFLTRLKTSLRLPIIYVTHAMEEITLLGDWLVLLERGHVLASGAASALMTRVDLPLARRDDAAALVPCHVVSHDPSLTLTRLDGGGRSFLVPLLNLPVGHACRMRIPGREVILATKAPEAISVHNVVAGTVLHLAEDPANRSVLVEIALSEATLLSRVTPDAINRLRLAAGSPVLALIKSTSIEVQSGL